jgi:hypothetical protein
MSLVRLDTQSKGAFGHDVIVGKQPGSGLDQQLAQATIIHPQRVVPVEGRSPSSERLRIFDRMPRWRTKSLKRA